MNEWVTMIQPAGARRFVCLSLRIQLGSASSKPRDRRLPDAYNAILVGV